jgi:hypothetical protein
MALMFCVNHPELRWHCKDIAISSGRYNGSRNIFFFGQATEARPSGVMVIDDSLVFECECKSSDLRVIPGTYTEEI